MTFFFIGLFMAVSAIYGGIKAIRKRNKELGKLTPEQIKHIESLEE